MGRFSIRFRQARFCPPQFLHYNAEAARETLRQNAVTIPVKLGAAALSLRSASLDPAKEKTHQRPPKQRANRRLPEVQPRPRAGEDLAVPAGEEPHLPQPVAVGVFLPEPRPRLQGSGGLPAPAPPRQRRSTLAQGAPCAEIWPVARLGEQLGGCELNANEASRWQLLVLVLADEASRW
nr:unnamed protein product [Digitaria exilis]